jgi:hypothetical protein
MIFFSSIIRSFDYIFIFLLPYFFTTLSIFVFGYMSLNELSKDLLIRYIKLYISL